MSEKNRVLFFDDAEQFGGGPLAMSGIMTHFGGERVLLRRFACGEEESRYPAEIILRLPHFSYPRHLSSPVTQLFFLPKLIFYIATILWMLRRMRPHLVFANTLLSLIPLAICAKVWGARLVWCAHSSDIPNNRSLRRLVKQAKLVLCVSEVVRDRVAALDSCIPTLIVHNSAEAKGDNLPKALPGDIRLGYVGRLSEEKGLDVLLRAMAQLDQRFVLTLVGDGPERHRLIQLSQELGIAEQVNFVGMKSELLPYYLGFDFLCLTSPQEGNPLVVIEALNAGIPVIATPSEALVRVFGDLSPVHLAADFSPESVAKMISACAGQKRPEEQEFHRARQRFSRAAQRKALQREFEAWLAPQSSNRS
ncbi:MAG: hypothetical protein RL095_385 [Verrucomicrobiota bacterium]|jgi:glycosyltransferase involved in cell wall biosynthesis